MTFVRLGLAFVLSSCGAAAPLRDAPAPEPPIAEPQPAREPPETQSRVRPPSHEAPLVDSPPPPSDEPVDFVTGVGPAVADSGSSAAVWNRRDPDVTPPRLVRQGFHCPFPEEAELEGDDSAAVVLVVRVAADGRTRSVSVVRSPGQGFDQMARRCLLEATFLPARARDGTAVEGRATVRVVFRR